MRTQYTYISNAKAVINKVKQQRFNNYTESNDSVTVRYVTNSL